MAARKTAERSYPFGAQATVPYRTRSISMINANRQHFVILNERSDVKNPMFEQL